MPGRLGSRARGPDAPTDVAAKVDDDAELVARAQRDPRAFAPLYARYAVPVYRYCYRRLGNHEASEDATSQTFIKALAALPRYREGSFRGWLFAIAHNVVNDAHRGRRPQVAIEAAPLVDGARTPEEQALSAEVDRSVEALLDRLAPDQRPVVALRLAGLTGPEIAAVLGRHPAAVKSAQFRAYTRLRRLMGGGVGEGGVDDEP